MVKILKGLTHYTCVDLDPPLSLPSIFKIFMILIKLLALNIFGKAFLNFSQCLCLNKKYRKCSKCRI